MKYMGSKSSIAKYILPIILKDRKEYQFYVEPFCGGCNTIDKVSGPRIASDINNYLIELLRSISAGWVPEKISRELYFDIRDNKNKYPDNVVGYAGIISSYSGKWFGGYAGCTVTKINTVRDYQDEGIRNVLKQSNGLIGIDFRSCSYSELIIPKNSIIYCDPPYKGATGYLCDFNYYLFYEWLIKMKYLGHTVFVSEYYMPHPFICIFEHAVKSSLSANGVCGGSKASLEKLYTI